MVRRTHAPQIEARRSTTALLITQRVDSVREDALVQLARLPFDRADVGRDADRALRAALIDRQRSGVTLIDRRARVAQRMRARLAAVVEQWLELRTGGDGARRKWDG